MTFSHITKVFGTSENKTQAEPLTWERSKWRMNQQPQMSKCIIVLVPEWDNKFCVLALYESDHYVWWIMRTWPVNEVTHFDKDANGDDHTQNISLWTSINFYTTPVELLVVVKDMVHPKILSFLLSHMCFSILFEVWILRFTLSHKKRNKYIIQHFSFHVSWNENNIAGWNGMDE